MKRQSSCGALRSGTGLRQRRNDRVIILANVELGVIIAGMIGRRLLGTVRELLEVFPAVALLGARQVGKTTLALELAGQCESVYLDLEREADRARLTDAAQYLQGHEDRLVVLDEVHRAPGLFQTLRGLIDDGRRRGRRTGRFLLLGSASPALLRQTGESLAGRIAYLELPPLGVLETGAQDSERLWLRGGFPDSFLAATDQRSLAWRENFIRTYLERDIPQLGPRIPAETLRRFWTMLAHSQGGLHNAAQLAGSLAVSGKTIASYLDLMVDLLLVRRLAPQHVNVKKRLVKAPRVYVRDSGVLHALLRIPDWHALLGHPILGASWEGFVIDNILAAAPADTLPSFYRTASGAEIDLILELPGLTEKWAIEIKRSAAPKPSKGFHSALADLAPSRAFIVHPGADRYPLAQGIEAISLQALAQALATR